MARLILALSLLVAVGAGLATPLSAQTSIVAVVNGVPITSYDVSQRAKLLQLTGTRGNTRSVALDELINEMVQTAATKRARISATDEEVTEAFNDIAKRVKLSPAQLGQALTQSGVNPETLRDRLRAQISFSKLVRAAFRATAQVSEQDLVAALLKNEGGAQAVDAAIYDLKQVIIALPKEPSDKRLRQANARAADLRSRFTSCSGGEQLARKTRNVVVKDFGTRNETTLTQDVVEKLKDVPVGRLSEPIETPTGLVMFAVCDKTVTKSVNAAMQALEPDMTRERGEQFSKQYLRQLRRDAVIEMR